MQHLWKQYSEKHTLRKTTLCQPPQKFQQILYSERDLKFLLRKNNLCICIYTFKRPKFFQAWPPEHVNDVPLTLFNILWLRASSYTSQSNPTPPSRILINNWVLSGREHTHVHSWLLLSKDWLLRLHWWSRVKNLPANAGDTGSNPDPGRSHVLRGNKPCGPQLLSPRSRGHMLQLLKSTCTRARALQQEKPLQWEAHARQLEQPQLEKVHV